LEVVEVRRAASIALLLEARVPVDPPETRLGDWFGGPKGIDLDEEVVGLGSYGFTLTVLSSEAKLAQPDEEEDEDTDLERSWTPKFAYGR
jgi:hypothetical protein